MKSIEDWKAELSTPDWLFAATKAAQKWGEGKRVEKATYEKAVGDTGDMKFYAYAPPAKEVLVPNTPADSAPSAMPMVAEPDVHPLAVEEPKKRR